MSRTNTTKVVLTTAYMSDIAQVSLHSTDPGSNGASEIAGGTPPYARVAPGTITYNTTGQGSVMVTFNVASGTTVGGIGLWDSSGNFLDGGPVTPYTFGSQGTATATVTVQSN